MKYGVRFSFACWSPLLMWTGRRNPTDKFALKIHIRGSTSSQVSSGQVSYDNQQLTLGNGYVSRIAVEGGGTLVITAPSYQSTTVYSFNPVAGQTYTCHLTPGISVATIAVITSGDSGAILLNLLLFGGMVLTASRGVGTLTGFSKKQPWSLDEPVRSRRNIRTSCVWCRDDED